MIKGLTGVLTVFAFFCALSGHTYALDGEEVERLKKAGMSDETIGLMILEKTVETCLFTVDEIIGLKEAGLSNDTIQLLIKKGSFMKGREAVVYGRDIRSIRFTTVNDLIRLKEAGMSDEVIQAVIRAVSEGEEEESRKEARETLRDMEIIVDTRGVGE